MLGGGTKVVSTVEDVAAWSTLGGGLMLWVNVPITLLLSAQAMQAWGDYRRRARGERRAGAG